MCSSCISLHCRGAGGASRFHGNPCLGDEGTPKVTPKAGGEQGGRTGARLGGKEPLLLSRVRRLASLMLGNNDARQRFCRILFIKSKQKRGNKIILNSENKPTYLNASRMALCKVQPQISYSRSYELCVSFVLFFVRKWECFPKTEGRYFQYQPVY